MFRLVCSSLILGICLFDLLPEALLHLDSYVSISMVYVGIIIHQCFHIFVPHKRHDEANCNSATTSSTTQLPHVPPFGVQVVCQECEPELSTAQQNPKRSHWFIPWFVFALHSFLDGLMIGSLTKIQSKMSGIFALIMCLVQDSFVLVQRLCDTTLRYHTHTLGKICAVAFMSIALTSGTGVVLGVAIHISSDVLYSILSLCIGTLLCESVEGNPHIHTWKDWCAVILGTGISIALSFVHV
jgi:hypothetical protein